MKNPLTRWLTFAAASAVIFAIAGAAPARADDRHDRYGRNDRRYSDDRHNSYDRHHRDRDRSDFRIELNYGGYSRPYRYNRDYDSYGYNNYGYIGGYDSGYYSRNDRRRNHCDDW